MALTSIVAAALLAQAPAQVDVGYDELAVGQDQAAISTILANEELPEADPARLINLGVAYARQGREAQARAMFQRAAESELRTDLETADGRFVDSRYLARKALALMDRGELGGTSRMTMR